MTDTTDRDAAAEKYFATEPDGMYERRSFKAGWDASLESVSLPEVPTTNSGWPYEKKLHEEVRRLKEEVERLKVWSSDSHIQDVEAENKLLTEQRNALILCKDMQIDEIKRLREALEHVIKFSDSEFGWAKLLDEALKDTRQEEK